MRREPNEEDNPDDNNDDSAPAADAVADTTPQQPDLPPPTNPEFIRMMQILDARVEVARKEKAEAIEALSRDATDEEIRNDIGLDLSVLREDL